MDFKSITINMVLVILFIFSLLMAVTLFSSENNTGLSFVNTSLEHTIENLNDTLDNFSSDANDTTTSFMNEGSGLNVLTQFGFYFKSIISAGNTFISFLPSLFTYFIFGVAQKELGIHPIVTGTIMGILLFTMVFALWRVYRSGE